MDPDEQLIQDLLWVMENEAGRRLMRRIVYDLCGLHHLIVDQQLLKIRAGDTAALHAFFTDGKRWVGASINRWLQQVPLDLRELMMSEMFAESRVAQATSVDFSSADPQDRA